MGGLLSTDAPSRPAPRQGPSRSSLQRGGRVFGQRQLCRRPMESPYGGGFLQTPCGESLRWRIPADALWRVPTVADSCRRPMESAYGGPYDSWRPLAAHPGGSGPSTSSSPAATPALPQGYSLGTVWVHFDHSPHPTTSPDLVSTQCDVVLKFLSDIPTARLRAVR